MGKQNNRKGVILCACAGLCLLGCDATTNNMVKEQKLESVQKEPDFDIRNEIVVETYKPAEKEISEDEKEMTWEQAKTYQAFDCVDIKGLSEEEIDIFFRIQEIDEEIFNRINGISYHENDYVKPENLRYLRVLHWGFDDKVHVGELIVNEKIAEKTLKVFRELFLREYPIEKMYLVDYYQANDDLSMADNNSSAFNYRTISGTTKISNHGYGLAIDINPFFNPYIHKKNGVIICDPVGSEEFMDRNKDFRYKIDENDLAYQLLVKEGFSWGGAWKNSKDYQHFEYLEK